MVADTLAVVPARGGSKGLAGKNIRPFLSRPLMDWSLEVGELCPSVKKTILTSDNKDYLERATHFSKAVPLLRPSELAQDNSPMSAVIAHATRSAADEDIEFVLLLDPTSPIRNPSEIEGALDQLRKNPHFVGGASMSQPEFNMRWVGVELADQKAIRRAFPGGSSYASRQEVPPLWRLNGTFYIWRTSLAKDLSDPWLEKGPHLGIETPDDRAFSIDTLKEFEIAETLLKSGLIDWEVPH